MTVDTKVRSRYSELVRSLGGWSCTASNLVLRSEMAKVVREKEESVKYESRNNTDSGVS